MGPGLWGMAAVRAARGAHAVLGEWLAGCHWRAAECKYCTCFTGAFRFGGRRWGAVATASPATALPNALAAELNVLDMAGAIEKCKLWGFQ